MKDENKEYKKIFDELIKLGFTTKNASKGCCYFDLPSGESIRYCSNDTGLIRYSEDLRDLGKPITIEEVKELIRL